MVLHLAGRYAESNVVLEEAHYLVEDMYTKRLRDTAAAMLLNEARQPYKGAPHEHVLINVIKGLNYALQQQWDAALVEARRIDHRLNVLSDQEEGTDTYQEDPFARYVVGLLYDIAGDVNNAYVGYRKAEQVYEQGKTWTRVVFPEVLKQDLIRTAKRLGLHDDVRRYQKKFPEISPQATKIPSSQMAQIIAISYHGQGPQKEDLFVDVPVSLDALQLVALTKPGFGRSTRRTRGGEALLYGLHGRIARIALPRFSLNRQLQTVDTIQVKGASRIATARTQRLYDINAVAEKTLSDVYDNLVLRAVARTAMKMAAAEGIRIGARAAGGKKNRDWIGPLVGGLARVVALATEEADIRSWRTLPGEIQLARLWVEPGSYSVAIQSRLAQNALAETSHDHRQLQLEKGETRFVLYQNGQ